VTSTVVSRGGRLVACIERDGGRHVTVDVKSKNPLTAPLRVAALRRVLREINPDLVHYRSRVPGWLFRFANRNLRLPFVTTVHGFNSPGAYSRIMAVGARVICPSTAVVEFVRRHYDISADKIRLIPRGVDPQQFDPARLDAAFMAEFRDWQGLAGRFVVLGVGRITPLKGYDV
jgi:glycosyltransferase involved in cell wall biosynthesis